MQLKRFGEIMENSTNRTPIVQVMFRDVYSKDFTNGPYTYVCPLTVCLGDLVLVNTKFGISLAQIHRIDLKLVGVEESLKLNEIMELCKLKEVVELCKTKQDLPLL